MATSSEKRTHDSSPLADWEPDAPVDDTLLRQFVVNWTASIEAHGAPAGGRVLRRDGVAAVDLGRPSLGGNVATLTAPLFADHVDELNAVLDAFYRFSAGTYTGSVYLFSPWPTPDLAPYGWSLVDYQPLMFRPAGGTAPPAPSDLTIDPVRDGAALSAFEEVAVRGFEMPELEGHEAGTHFSADLLRDSRFHFWVGHERGRAVCAASTFVDAGINNVAIVATVPEARRRGYGAAMTWQASLADPTLPALLIATGEGRQVYERIGYYSLFRFTVWSQER